METDVAAVRAALEAYVTMSRGPVRSIAIGPAGRIDKGHVSRGLELFDVTVGHDDGTSYALRVVRKHTGPNEVLALRALGSVPDASGLPVLIADGHDAAGAWVLVPFYAGSNPAGRLDAPAAVFDTLAHVHAHYERRCDQLAGVITIDTRWWGDLAETRSCPSLTKRSRPESSSSSESLGTLSSRPPRTPGSVARWSGCR